MSQFYSYYIANRSKESSLQARISEQAPELELQNVGPAELMGLATMFGEPAEAVTGPGIEEPLDPESDLLVMPLSGAFLRLLSSAAITELREVGHSWSEAGGGSEPDALLILSQLQALARKADSQGNHVYVAAWV